MKSGNGPTPDRLTRCARFAAVLDATLALMALPTSLAVAGLCLACAGGAIAIWHRLGVSAGLA